MLDLLKKLEIRFFKKNVLIAAEMEFYDDLNERIRGGELISSTDAEKLYRDMMEDHKITEYSISRKVLIEDIRRYLPDIVCTEKKGSKTSLLHSKSIGRDGIDIVTEEKDVEKSLKTLLMASVTALLSAYMQLARKKVVL